MVQAAVGALDELLLIIVPIVVFRITYGLARGRRPRAQREER